MLLANLITPKKINVLGVIRFSFCFILTASFFPAFSQDNSPYSRYGLGDLVPSTNSNTRGMGGISAGYIDFLSINFNNPASYSSFQSFREAKAKKLLYGRAILDLGINLENHTLIEPNRPGKFTSSNILFSHVQVGVPLRSNWGLSFGLRPITRISYKMNQGGKVLDAVTGLPTGDSALTLSQGDGGAYLATIGTGVRIKNLSIGANIGYMFGKQDYSSRKSIINDTVAYNSGNFETKTSYGNIYFNAGLQYQIKLDSSTFMVLGAYGNMKQKLNANQDLTRETYYYDASAGNVRIDSVYEKNGVKGTIEYPSSFTAGFIIQRLAGIKSGGWLVGVDFSQTSWKNYTFYGRPDSLRNNWTIRIGGELRPSLSAARRGYFGNVAFRAGFFFGPDYIQVQQKLPVMGMTFGLGLPIRNYNRLSPGQATLVNLAFEYVKRGNNKNILKENMFRVSASFSLSDFWFAKKKYE
jgi:hypothetical protein